MKDRRWIFSILCVMAISAMFVGTSLAKQPASEQPGEDEEFDETAPDTPLPPGMKERVFIHLPRAYKPGHLGTCTPTTNASVTDYGLAGWRLPDTGITWRLNSATVPSSVGATAAIALNSAFATWTAADGKEKFSQGPNTSVTRSRLDFVNAVLWGRISAGAIAITYIRYYTATGIVADVDTVFNSRYPWAIFNPALGVQCQSNPDAYDVENIGVHEFGHWVGLDDLYSDWDKDLTMYGYGAGGELKKRTLGTGDITGAQAVAP